MKHLVLSQSSERRVAERAKQAPGSRSGRAWARATDAIRSCHGDRDIHASFNSGEPIDTLAVVGWVDAGLTPGHGDIETMHDKHIGTRCDCNECRDERVCACDQCEARFLRSLGRAVVKARVALREAWIAEGGRTRKAVAVRC